MKRSLPGKGVKAGLDITVLVRLKRIPGKQKMSEYKGLMEMKVFLFEIPLS